MPLYNYIPNTNITRVSDTDDIDVAYGVYEELENSGKLGDESVIVFFAQGKFSFIDMGCWCDMPDDMADEFEELHEAIVQGVHRV